MRLIIQHGDDWLSFKNPVEVLTARTPDEVFQCLEKIERSGLWAAGFVSYEAASAFDDALKTHAPGNLPLLQFGLFDAPEPHPAGPAPLPRRGLYSVGKWRPSVTRAEYFEAFASIKEHIAAGDTYQVNYTFRLNTEFSGDPYALFCDLAAAQQGRYAAFIETDEFAICSASPELFFELKDGVITAKPMKGTLPRGLSVSQDRKNAEVLKSSAKDRAENIMIVDMIRNDIGRVAETGSVEPIRCFEVEKYPTVWQMTSTVVGKIPFEKGLHSKGTKNAKSLQYRPFDSLSPSCLCGEKTVGLAGLMKALFPCASITGAPKAKTMELIQGLEKSTRGVYTGSIGFVAPDGTAQFNVAIRTAVIQDGQAEYGIGGGIVWDSDAASEYEEAITKSRILTRRSPKGQRRCFQLLETMLYEDGEIFLLERHLKRLAESVEYFDFKFDREKICDHLRFLRIQSPSRVRLLLNPEGEFEIQTFELKRLEASSTLAIAKRPVDSQDVFLYHKTTNRTVYEKAKADFSFDEVPDRPRPDDVLLFNERGEVTESCVANVVVEFDGRKVTPPVSCGLLAGTFRDELLDLGEIKKGVVTLEDLKRADSVWLINSVRKWRRATLV